MSDTGPSAPAPAEKSEGQALLERMLAQCNRFNRIRQQLEQVRGSIAPARPSARPAPSIPQAKPAPATSFFEALHMLADGNDAVAGELEAGVSDLAKLF